MPRSRLYGLAVLLAVVPSAAAPAEPPRAGGVRASSSFWSAWGDGRAEISGYRLRMPRYGELREGEAVLVYVTEDMDRRTWIKDDRSAVPAEHREPVLKLNHLMRFRTGIYPYSVMTSVFAPVNGRSPERFAPAKISFSAQEWCGHVFQVLWPVADRFRREIHSYFSVEGDTAETVETPPGTLYEDALLLHLRELDGPFAGGGDWAGPLIPSLWSLRAGHRPPRPAPATIHRRTVRRDGRVVTLFILQQDGRERTFVVEADPPRRILEWKGPAGEEASILGTVRLPYWRLNHEGEESYRREIGLQP